MVAGIEFAKRSYLRILACNLLGVTVTVVTSADLIDFLKMNRRIGRVRVGEAIYYNATQFIKEWQRKHRPQRTKEKLR